MDGSMKRYKQIPHTADIGAKIYGKDIPELFANAAFAMFDLMAGIGKMAKGEGNKVEVEVQGPDFEGLLVSWLNELLYLSFNNDLLFCKFDVISLEKTRLKAEVTGQSLEANKGRLRREIKAATYHDLKITKDKGRYEVTIIFDV